MKSRRCPPDDKRQAETLSNNHKGTKAPRNPQRSAGLAFQTADCCGNFTIALMTVLPFMESISRHPPT